MGRHHPGPTEEDIRSLLADIDANVQDLDQRLAAAQQESAPRPPARAAVPPAATLAAQPPAAAAAADDEGSSSFLAELEREASGVAGTSDHQRRYALAQRQHEALERIFKFFNTFSQHANRLALEISRAYRLDGQTAYAGLRWQGAFADYRKESTAENALLNQVTFRVRLVAPQPLTVVRRWDQLDAFQQELHILNLRTLDDIALDKKPQQERFQLRLAPEVPLQISFQANPNAGHIDIVCRNLEGLGISAFCLDLDEVSQKMLDDIGRFLVCRSNTLPAALRRTHYRPKT